MSGVPILEELRPRAFAVAYRMLGSMSEAEDIVQEALLRLHHAPMSRPWSPGCASTSCDRLMCYGDRIQRATHQPRHVR
jgi:hypothetical protein